MWPQMDHFDRRREIDLKLEDKVMYSSHFSSFEIAVKTLHLIISCNIIHITSFLFAVSFASLLEVLEDTDGRGGGGGG